MRSIYSLTIILFFVSIIGVAGNYPFPQNVEYVYGIKPTNAKHTDALAAYTKWKNQYVVNDGGNRKRVLFGDEFNSTVSEGIAYGMLVSAYADDSVTFNGLWRYYKKYRNVRGIMNWKISGTGSVSGSGGATDAEEDAAMALIIAEYQWGNALDFDYMTDAKDLINAIMNYEVLKPSYMLKAGDQWGNANVTNPSYFAPAYYRIFYIVTQDAQWLQVLEKCYDILSLNAHPTTGLVSDWCKEDGTITDRNFYSWQKFEYSYDACRMPWRLATDYLWFGEERAKQQCTKIANFVKNTVKGSTRIVDGYELNGAKIGTFHSSTFVSMFALAGMVDASFQSHLNASYTDNVKTVPGGYFDQMLQTLSLFMLTGNFYRLPPPECQSFSLGSDLSLCTTPSPTLDPQLPAAGRNFKWNTGETTPTITKNVKGTYILKVDSAGCVRKDTINLWGLKIDLGTDQEITVVDSIMLNAVSEGAGVTYTWNTGATSKTIYATNAGLYWVQVDSAGCSFRDSINIGYQESDKIEVFPNPTDGEFKMILYDATADKANIIIYSTQGKLVMETTITGILPGQPIKIDLSSLATGMYIVRTKTEKATKSKKIIIH